MAWFGNVGSLVEVTCASAVPVESVLPSSSHVTLGGRRLLQVGPRVLRAWSVDLGAATTARDHSVVAAFLHGEFGPGPFWWISDWAKHTNVLPPDVSLLMTGAESQNHVIQSHPMRLPDGGVSGKSIFVGAGNFAHLSWKDGTFLPIPLVVGRRARFSAYLAGEGGYIQARVRNHAGTVVRTIASSPTVSWQPERVTTWLTPREGETDVTFRVMAPSSNGVRATRPAITFTDGLQDWAVGAGAQKAVITQQSVDPTISWDTSQLAGGGYQIVEVG